MHDSREVYCTVTICLCGAILRSWAQEVTNSQLIFASTTSHTAPGMSDAQYAVTVLKPQNLINQVPEFANLDFWWASHNFQRKYGFHSTLIWFTVTPYFPALLQESFQVSFSKCLALFLYIFKETLVTASTEGSVFPNSHSSWLFLGHGSLVSNVWACEIA